MRTQKAILLNGANDSERARDGADGAAKLGEGRLADHARVVQVDRLGRKILDRAEEGMDLRDRKGVGQLRGSGQATTADQRRTRSSSSVALLVGSRSSILWTMSRMSSSQLSG